MILIIQAVSYTHLNGKYLDRKFDWNNLFWACGHCNNVKNQNKYDEGIIDCCKTDPEEVISFQLENENVHIFARDEKDKNSLLTAELVTEVFSLRNTSMRVYTVSYTHLLKKLERLLL